MKYLFIGLVITSTSVVRAEGTAIAGVGPAEWVSIARDGDSSWLVHGTEPGSTWVVPANPAEGTAFPPLTSFPVGPNPGNGTAIVGVEPGSTWVVPANPTAAPGGVTGAAPEVPAVAGTAIAGVGPAEWVSIARDGDSSWLVHGTEPGSTWVVPANPTVAPGGVTGAAPEVPAVAGTAIAGVGPAEWVSIARDGDSSWYVHYTVPGSTWVVPANPAESSAVGPSPTFPPLTSAAVSPSPGEGTAIVGVEPGSTWVVPAHPADSTAFPPLTSFAVGPNPGDGTAIVGVEPGSTWVVPANPIQSSGVVPANPTLPPLESSAVASAKPTAATIESSAVGPAQYVSLAREGDSSWYVAGVIKGEGDSTWFEAFPGEVTPAAEGTANAEGTTVIGSGLTYTTAVNSELSKVGEESANVWWKCGGEGEEPCPRQVVLHFNRGAKFNLGFHPEIVPELVSN